MARPPLPNPGSALRRLLWLLALLLLAHTYLTLGTYLAADPVQDPAATSFPARNHLTHPGDRTPLE